MSVGGLAHIAHIEIIRKSACSRLNVDGYVGRMCAEAKTKGVTP
jgi:hypothetical protein